MAIEIIDGLFGDWSVYDGAVFVGRVKKEGETFVGRGPRPEVAYDSLDGVDAVAAELVRLDQEQRAIEQLQPDPKKKIRGPRILTIGELLAIFESETSSVYWRDRAYPTAFLMNWRLSLLDELLKAPDGGFFHALKREDYFDG